MTHLDLGQYPLTLPEFHVTPLDGRITETIDCPELQWWFVVPRPGEVTNAVWYDRDTGDITRVRKSSQPIVASFSEAGGVKIDIDEWVRDPQHPERFDYDKVTMEATLTPERAEFRSVTIAGKTASLGEREFDDSWTGVGSRKIIDDGRFQQISEDSYETTRVSGMGAGLVDVAIGGHQFHCLRVFDLPDAGGLTELGQPLIDLNSGRTLAYWQYRPAHWDPDAADWIEHHPGAGIKINNHSYQRRNCTGRDEIAFTQFALDKI